MLYKCYNDAALCTPSTECLDALIRLILLPLCFSYNHCLSRPEIESNRRVLLVIYKNLFYHPRLHLAISPYELLACYSSNTGINLPKTAFAER